MRIVAGEDVAGRREVFANTSLPMPTVDAIAPFPTESVALGTDAHLRLTCRTILDTHDPYRPALIAWPRLEEEARRRIVALPIWDVAVQTEGKTSLFVKTFANTIADPLLRAALEMNAFEESRHKLVLADMVRAYGIVLEPEPDYVAPKDAEWAFMRSGYSECIDSFFGFGLFRVAADSGFFPPALIDTFEPVMREEGRHILFFVNWVAWWRRNMPWWRRPWFEAKVIAVWLFLIWERIDTAKGIGGMDRADENNFTLNGSRQLGVELTFTDVATVCLAENERRLAPYDDRLVRPRLVPTVVRCARWIATRGRAAKRDR